MSKFIANVIKLFSATLLGQILGIAFSPVLSRLYSPAEFGNFQLFFSIVSIIAIMACFSYQGAINLPEKDDDAAKIVILSFCCICITTVTTSVFFIFFSTEIANFLNAPGLSNLLFLVPLAVVVNCVAYVMGFWLSRRQQFGTIAIANLTSSITGKTTSVVLGFLSATQYGLIFGTIINDFTIVLVLLKKPA